MRNVVNEAGPIARTKLLPGQVALQRDTLVELNLHEDVSLRGLSGTK